MYMLMLNNQNKLHAKLTTNCLDFNKDAKACQKKWQQIYKDYKYNKFLTLSWEVKDLRNVNGTYQLI